MGPLKVSASGRHLVSETGAPFFYLADTAWEMLHRLDRDATTVYLNDRASKGFAAIQTVILAEHEYSRPNADGFLPLVDNDPIQPVEGYFAHVDWAVREMNRRGMYAGLLPTWGDKWNKLWGAGPEIFTPENAFTFGQYLGNRYRTDDVIWILGGDRPVDTDVHRAIIEAMAAGIRAGDGGHGLITFHPNGQRCSSEWFHDAAWLDFNMAQTGHTRDRDNYATIAADYARVPVKPCIDAEPGYEDHPNGFDAANGYLDDYDTRKAAYWAVFAGACGHTYGCHPIWQFAQPGWAPVTHPQHDWLEAKDLPGAGQMHHLRRLIESRSLLNGVPDQALIVGNTGTSGNHIAAIRADNDSYAFIYTPTGATISVNMVRLARGRYDVSWMDPRTGGYCIAEHVDGTGTAEFTPPTQGLGNDWVLVLDKARQ